MSEISIRPLTANDRAAWEPLWQGYLTFYKASLTPETSDTTFARLTGGQEPMGGFIAERDGKALGIVNYVLHRTTWSQKEICYLQDLFTSEEARGHGVGRKLIEAVRQMAETKGLFRVYWQTHESNLQAQELYDKVAQKSGFIVYRQPLG
ncbi:GNAT family N-acetyltransferase [Bosea sp. (in: a-proteobacteria)]|jgi:GNAT superfamily N-acetyltransferase|uniref:GNAT family N-acetyltransferase n=1 Tax=Bosea sp. (in: a-proteobacteria) TaxID=1871050 RepID=UPI002DDCCADC|nr:GNAT family N-acetyltransferase [Bosea sp. (in: a-proteobacteria)]HEV2509260.1 GNAT family N-acetyltransferase [Bosea sp. (in: a-proteobacteria)]